MAIRITLNRVQLVRESSHIYDVPPVVSCPEDAAEIAKEVLSLEDRSEEIFACLFLNVKNHVVGVQEISRGSATASVVHPREVFKVALLHNAASIILMHNHPSGETEPSREDIATTTRLVNAGKLMDIPVLDHLIIGWHKYISMKEEGIIK